MQKQSNRSKGIYILPNLFTTASLFAGFYAIIHSIQGEYVSSAIAIFIATIMDSLDGRVARMTNTVSDFGKEYDSLADVIAFGLTPALVAYEWALKDLGKVGWLVAFLYVATTALRLARFNSVVADKRFFHGLPCPAAAALLAAFVWFFEEQGIAGVRLTIPVIILTVFLSFCMISSFPYYSFKDINFKGRMPFIGLFVVVIAIILIASNPSFVLFLLLLIYALSGMLIKIPFIRNRFKSFQSVPKTFDLDEDTDPEQ